MLVFPENSKYLLDIQAFVSFTFSELLGLSKVDFFFLIEDIKIKRPSKVKAMFFVLLF